MKNPTEGLDIPAEVLNLGITLAYFKITYLKEGILKMNEFQRNKLNLKWLLEPMHYTKDHEIHFIWHIVRGATRTFATNKKNMNVEGAPHSSQHEPFLPFSFLAL